MRKSLLPLVMIAVACAGHRTGVTALAPMPMGDIQFPPADSDHAVHLLNRMAFGPRPGDIAHV